MSIVVRMRHYCSIICCVILLDGCAAVSELPDQPQTVKLAVAPETQGKQAPVGSIPIDLLYLLLSAEIAGQKGAFDIAVDRYLKAAKSTGEPKVAERATQIALFTKDKEKAAEAVSLWLERDSESLPARKISALLNVTQGNFEKAISELEALRSRSDGEFGKTVLEITKQLENEVSSEDAIKFMERLTEAFPLQADVYYSFAVVTLTKNDLDRAAKEITRAIELRPDWNQARILYARIISQQGDSETARDLLKETVDQDPENEQLRMIFAQYLINVKDFDGAQAQLSGILKRNPKHLDAVYSLAIVKLQNNQDDAARDLLLKLVEAPNWRNQACYYIGRIEAKNKRREEAISWFEKVDHGPLLLDAQFKIVSVLVADKRFDEAVKKLHGLQDRFPSQRHRFLLMEAEILSDRKDYQRAFLILSRGLEFMPDQADLLYTRALVAENMGRLDVLEEDLKKILKKNPDDANALNALGYTLVDRTLRYKEAQDYLTRAIALKPNDPVIMDSYGWLKFRLGDLDQALDYLRRAYTKNNDSEIASHLGEVLWVLGRKAEANSVWQNALSKDPDNRYLLDVKERFPAAFSQKK